MGNTILKVMDLMLTLPDDTKIFCAVEGTKANMRFGKKAEPKNEKIKEFWTNTIIQCNITEKIEQKLYHCNR